MFPAYLHNRRPKVHSLGPHGRVEELGERGLFFRGILRDLLGGRLVAALDGGAEVLAEGLAESLLGGAEAEAGGGHYGRGSRGRLEGREGRLELALE